MHKVGILGFGSLISNPGEEIRLWERERLNCKTPFKVEFARISSSRKNAPTLIPVDERSKGAFVNGVIFVLDESVSLKEAKSILYRREIHSNNKAKQYTEPVSLTAKNVLIKELDDFAGVEKVIYTSFLIQDEYKNLSPQQLANFSVNSYLECEKEEKKDGINYLIAAKKYGIETELSREYEDEILKLTGAETLEEGMTRLDQKKNK